MGHKIILRHSFTTYDVWLEKNGLTILKKNREENERITVTPSFSIDIIVKVVILFIGHSLVSVLHW